MKVVCRSRPSSTRRRNFRAKKGPIFTRKPTEPAPPAGFSAIWPIFSRGIPLKKEPFLTSKWRVFPEENGHFCPARLIAAGDYSGFSVAERGGGSTTEKSLFRPAATSQMFHKCIMCNVLRRL
jgi:hypothetical protein